MKFVFDKDLLVKNIAIAQEIITSKSPLSIMSNVLLEAKDDKLIIKATDSAINYTTTINVEVQEEGSTTIFCDKFMAILSNLPNGEAEFIKDEILVTIKPYAKKRKFQLKSIAAEKFPEIPVIKDEKLYFKVPSKDLKEMIKQTIFAVSQDINRYFMTGVYFEKNDNKLAAISTDAKRLSYCCKDIVIPDFESAIVPTKILNCILKNAFDSGDIDIAFDGKTMFVKFGNYEFSTKLIDGVFPNYKRVIPDSQSNYFIVDKSDLDAAIKSMGIMIEKKIARIVLDIQQNELKIVAPESEIGNAEETIPIEYNGEPIQIAMNCNFLEMPLKVIESDKIKFEFTDKVKAVTIKPEIDKDYFHIVMPMGV